MHKANKLVSTLAVEMCMWGVRLDELNQVVGYVDWFVYKLCVEFKPHLSLLYNYVKKNK